MKNKNGTDPVTTNGPPRLSWAEQLSQMTKEEQEEARRRSQLAFNNSPESEEIWQGCLEMLKVGQQEEVEIRKQQEEKVIHESKTSSKGNKLIPFLQAQKEFSKSPESRQIVDEVIEALAQDRLRDLELLSRYRAK